MYEQSKIDEAAYFLGRVRAVLNDRQEVDYNLSAFLAAARSALQYALDEAKTKAGGQAWYERNVSASQVVKVFKDKRNISIHERPVKPSARYSIGLTEWTHVSDAVSMSPPGPEEPTATTVTAETPATATTPLASEGGSSTPCEYFFHDWPGNEDLLSLCTMYYVLCTWTKSEES